MRCSTFPVLSLNSLLDPVTSTASGHDRAGAWWSGSQAVAEPLELRSPQPLAWEDDDEEDDEDFVDDEDDLDLGDEDDEDFFDDEDEEDLDEEEDLVDDDEE